MVIDPWGRQGGIQWSAGTRGKPRGRDPADCQAKVGQSAPKAAFQTLRGVHDSPGRCER